MTRSDYTIKAAKVRNNEAYYFGDRTDYVGINLYVASPEGEVPNVFTMLVFA